MTSKTTNHCTFGATVEITDYARSVQGSTVSVAATLLPERKVEYRFFGVSVTVYVGKDNSRFKYETFSVACVLPPGERWKPIDPSIQVPR